MEIKKMINPFEDLSATIDCPKCGGSMILRHFIYLTGDEETYWHCQECDYEETVINEEVTASS